MKSFEKNTFPFFISGDIILWRFICVQNLGQIHIKNYLSSFLQNYLVPYNYGPWKLNHNGYKLIPVKKITVSSFISWKRVIV